MFMKLPLRLVFVVTMTRGSRLGRQAGIHAMAEIENLELCHSHEKKREAGPGRGALFFCVPCPSPVLHTIFSARTCLISSTYCVRSPHHRPTPGSLCTPCQINPSDRRRPVSWLTMAPCHMSEARHSDLVLILIGRLR